MTDDRIERAARRLAGRVQDAAGGLLGDDKLQLKGRAREAAGVAQDALGQAQLFVEDAVQDQPLMTLAAVAGVAFVLGFALGRR